MNIIISLYSEMSPRKYDDIKTWSDTKIGDETFVYLSDKSGVDRCYINVKDIRRMTIEDKQNEEA